MCIHLPWKKKRQVAEVHFVKQEGGSFMDYLEAQTALTLACQELVKLGYCKRNDQKRCEIPEDERNCVACIEAVMKVRASADLSDRRPDY